MLHGPTRCDHAFDKSTFNHSAGESAEGLVALIGQLREEMKRCLRILVDMAQGVPLHNRETQWGESFIKCSVMAHLQPFY